MSRIVVKLGGAVAPDAAGLVRRLAARNEVCVVHGAGEQISAAMERHGLEVQFVAGRRVTTPEALVVVREALLGVNAELCAAIGPLAVPLAGDEIGLRATHVPELGLVGEALPTSSGRGRGRARARRRPRRRAARRRPAERQRRRRCGRARSRHRRRPDPVRDRRPGLLLGGAVSASIGVAEAERLLDAGALSGGIVPKLRAALGAARSGVAGRDRRDGGGRVSVATTNALLPAYARQNVRFAYGEGSWLVDESGRRYLDLLAGIAVVGLGHLHPAPLAAAQAQLEKLWHVSNLYETEPGGAARGVAVGPFGGARAFFCNSGTEAVEAGLKWARKVTGRPVVVALHNSFHGRTHGSLAVTGQPEKRAAWEPLAPAARFATLNDTDSLAAAVGPDTAAILLEPVQGEGGIHAATPEFLAAARSLADEHGALLLLDEVQTGVGRTGTFFALEQLGVAPDAVTLAKGLGNGLPVGAFLVADSAPAGLEPGDHASTFGGNPVVCAAACAVVETVDADLLASVRAKGERLAAGSSRCRASSRSAAAASCSAPSSTARPARSSRRVSRPASSSAPPASACSA